MEKVFLSLVLSIYLFNFFFSSKLLSIITLECISILVISIFMVHGSSSPFSIFSIMIFFIFLVLESVFGMSILLSYHRSSEKSRASFNYY